MPGCKPSQAFALGCQLVPFLGLLLMVGCTRSSSSLPNSTADGQTAEQLLQRMQTVYHKAQSYTDHALYVQQTVRRGEGVEREIPFYQMSLALQRPNKLRFQLQEVTGRSTPARYEIVSNGTHVRSAVGQFFHQIHEAAAPAELTPENFIAEPTLRKEILQVSLENLFPQLAMLLAGSFDRPLFPDDSKPSLLTDSKLEGQTYHRIQLQNPAGKRVLWIDQENYSLRRMEIPIEAQRKMFDPNGQLSHLSIWIDFFDTKFDAGIEADAFEFDLPEGARRVRHFVASPPPGPPSFVGQPIGDFLFTSLDDEEVSPEMLAGKVAVLDFWFTGCAFCKLYTPVLEEVYQKYNGSENVALYAVSTDQADVPNDTLTETLQAWGGTMPVLRDIKRTSYKELNVEKYPTTLLVGSDGRVQMFLEGAHRHPEPLTTLIQKLLDGEDLAADAIAKHEKQLQQFEEKLEAATIQDYKAEDPIP